VLYSNFFLPIGATDKFTPIGAANIPLILLVSVILVVPAFRFSNLQLIPAFRSTLSPFPVIPVIPGQSNKALAFSF
jgi:hypothetical protein